jgi:ubiquinone biosynthesis protein
VSLAPLLRRLPRHVDRLATIAARGNLLLRLRLLSDASDVRLLTAWLNRLVLAFLGGVVGVMSVVLLGIRGGPPFTGSTTLFQLFGYFGLFCSTVLVMRVLVAVFRDGLN